MRINYKEMLEQIKILLLIIVKGDFLIQIQVIYFNQTKIYIRVKQ